MGLQTGLEDFVLGYWQKQRVYPEETGLLGLQIS